MVQQRVEDSFPRVSSEIVNQLSEYKE